MATGSTTPEREEEDYNSKPSAEDEYTALVASITRLLKAYALGIAAKVCVLYAYAVVKYIPWEGRVVGNLNQLKCKYTAPFESMDSHKYKEYAAAFETVDPFKYKYEYAAAFGTTDPLKYKDAGVGYNQLNYKYAAAAFETVDPLKYKDNGVAYKQVKCKYAIVDPFDPFNYTYEYAAPFGTVDPFKFKDAIVDPFDPFNYKYEYAAPFGTMYPLKFKDDNGAGVGYNQLYKDNGVGCKQVKYKYAIVDPFKYKYEYAAPFGTMDPLKFKDDAGGVGYNQFSYKYAAAFETVDPLKYKDAGVGHNQLKYKYAAVFEILGPHIGAAAVFGIGDPLKYKGTGLGFWTVEPLKYKDIVFSTIAGQEHYGYDVSCVLYPVVFSYGEPGSRFAYVPKFGDRDLPDDILRAICSFLPVDLVAHYQTINSAWHQALKPLVAPERLRMMEPARLAAHQLVVHQQRGYARAVANLMQEDETFYGAVARLTFESNESIVPFCKAGELLGRLRNNPNIGREHRAYFVRLYEKPAWRV